jgi:membrane-associated PAP2 superfamily phosphatase
MDAAQRRGRPRQTDKNMLMARAASATDRSRLTGQAMALAVLLLVQFFVGMITNLFVTIPDSHPGAGAKDFFSGAPRSVAWAISSGPTWLAIHAALGLALCVASILFIITAARARDRLWIWLSVAGCLLMIGAAFNGASFVTYNHDFSSLIMAGLFALTLATYLAGIYYASRRAPVAGR